MVSSQYECGESNSRRARNELPTAKEANLYISRYLIRRPKLIILNSCPRRHPSNPGPQNLIHRNLRPLSVRVKTPPFNHSRCHSRRTRNPPLRNLNPRLNHRARTGLPPLSRPPIHPQPTTNNLSNPPFQPPPPIPRLVPRSTTHTIACTGDMHACYGIAAIGTG